MPIPVAWLDELSALAAVWEGGDRVDAATALQTLETWRVRLGRPAAPGEEWLDVVRPDGEPYGWSAPRWFCHLVGLRHRVVYVYLTTPQGLLALQMRAHTKPEWPSLFDTTVAGHVKAGHGWEEGVWAEIEEELGLSVEDGERWLAEGRLEPIGGYERYGVDDGLP
ncbi:MAG: NUDIX domain-containing protein, partial [Caldilineales bacterium]|nr:NUDIX domain-containing protein [Caldilineales bacterium]